MSHTDYRTLLDRGRKSGLKTSELYSALAARHPEIGDFQNGQADTNGFVPTLDQEGHPSFKPQQERS